MLLRRMVNDVPHDSLEQSVLCCLPYEPIDTASAQGYWADRSQESWVDCQGVILAGSLKHCTV